MGEPVFTAANKRWFIAALPGVLVLQSPFQHSSHEHLLLLAQISG